MASRVQGTPRMHRTFCVSAFLWGEGPRPREDSPRGRVPNGAETPAPISSVEHRWSGRKPCSLSPAPHHTCRPGAPIPLPHTPPTPTAPALRVQEDRPNVPTRGWKRAGGVRAQSGGSDGSTSPAPARSPGPVSCLSPQAEHRDAHPWRPGGQAGGPAPGGGWDDSTRVQFLGGWVR